MGGKDCSKLIWEMVTGCAHELCTRAVPEELDLNLAWHRPLFVTSPWASAFTLARCLLGLLKLRESTQGAWYRHLGQWLLTKGPRHLKASFSAAPVRGHGPQVVRGGDRSRQSTRSHAPTPQECCLLTEEARTCLY